MQKVALNTYLEADQKARLEELARSRGVSQATLVREAIGEYVARRQTGPGGEPPEAVWGRLLSGYYAGDGTPNDHDDIYDD